MGQPQTKILTVTLNPALDLSTGTAAVRPGLKLRCDPPRYDPGGGGINISRAIAALGGSSHPVVALGGATGQQMAQLLLAQGLETTAITAPGETRLSFAVTDQSDMSQYRFVLPGPKWPTARVEAALTAIVDAAADGFIVFSGSQPPGVPDDFIARLAAALPASAKLIADTSGSPLVAATSSRAMLLDTLRMDSEEAETIAKGPLTTRKDSADFAQALVRNGAAQRVIIARGADGSVLATSTDRWFCEAAHVPVQSKIGAGDSFVAGFVLALARRLPVTEALAHGVAAASAAVMTPATELCRRADAEALIKVCAVSAI